MPRRKQADAVRKMWCKHQKMNEQWPSWPKRFRKWTNEFMVQAMEAVQLGTMGANRAARIWCSFMSQNKCSYRRQLEELLCPAGWKMKVNTQQAIMHVFKYLLSNISHWKYWLNSISVHPYSISYSGNFCSTHWNRGWWWEGMAPKMARPRLLDGRLLDGRLLDGRLPWGSKAYIIVVIWFRSGIAKLKICQVWKSGTFAEITKFNASLYFLWLQCETVLEHVGPRFTPQWERRIPDITFSGEYKRILLEVLVQGRAYLYLVLG